MGSHVTWAAITSNPNKSNGTAVPKVIAKYVHKRHPHYTVRKV